MKSLVGKMNNITILDACTIINILHIDDEDDFLFKQLRDMQIFLPQIVMEEVYKNRRKEKVDESKEHQIDKNIGILNSNIYEVDKTSNDEIITRVKDFAKHIKKENGELYATALALKLSRDLNNRVFFYTDDYPARQEFEDFFEYQQIGYIQDSVDLLVYLYRLKNSDFFPKKKLQNYLSLLSIEYSKEQKKIVDIAEAYKQKFDSVQNRRKDKALFSAIDGIIDGFYTGKNSYEEGVRFFRNNKGKISAIDKVLQVMVENEFPKIPAKVKITLTRMNNCDIIQI